MKNFNKVLNRLNMCFKEYGAVCRAFFRGSGSLGVSFYAIVQDYATRRRVRYHTDVTIEDRLPAGVLRPDSMILYTPHSMIWSNPDIRILYHGRPYTVDHVAHVPIGDTVVYVWAIMHPVVSRHDDDYEPIGGDDNAVH